MAAVAAAVRMTATLTMLEQAAVAAVAAEHAQLLVAQVVSLERSRSACVCKTHRPRWSHSRFNSALVVPVARVALELPVSWVARVVQVALHLTEAAVAETVAQVAQAERLVLAAVAVAARQLVCHEMLRAPRLVCQATAAAQAVLVVLAVTLAQPDQ